MSIILIVNSVVLSFFGLQNFYYSYSLLTSISIHLLSIYKTYFIIYYYLVNPILLLNYYYSLISISIIFIISISYSFIIYPFYNFIFMEIYSFFIFH